MRVRIFLFLLLMAGVPIESIHANPAIANSDRALATSVPANEIANKLPHQLLHPGDFFYPEALAKKGIQGEVVLNVILSKDGRISVTKITTSSQSSELDKNALNFVNTGYYKLPDKGIKYFEGSYSLSIIFLRDTVLTLNDKTCADFNADIAYFRSINPKLNIKKLGALELVAGIFTVQLMKGQGSSGTLKFVSSVDAINKDSAAACARRPAEAFIKTYVSAAKKNGIKF